jgi:hypothetical protein
METSEEELRMSASRRVLQFFAVIAVFALAGPAGAFAGGRHDDGDSRGDWGKHHWRGHHGGKPDKPSGPAIKVVASGLQGPFGIDAKGNKVFAADSFGNQVVRVSRFGEVTPAVTGLESPNGVARAGGGLAVVTGETGAPGGSSLYFAEIGGPPQLLADLLAYELANNPDGQLQFDPETNEPLDALSNPFAVIKAEGRPFVLVADGGANAVLSVSRSGEVSTFFVPPVVTTGACAGRPNNDPDHTGCDSVPTGLAYGPHGKLYVSTLSGEAPGEGRVYVLNAKNGKVLDVIGGLDSPTGVAVSPHGTVYTSHVLEGSPPDDQPPPPGFDPATVGQITRIARDGTRTTAQVTMPVGLDYHDGTLYSSAWAVATFLGIPNAGQIVTVAPHAFS